MSLELRGQFFHVASSVSDWYTRDILLATGCTKISPGCEHCSAAEVLARAPKNDVFVGAVLGDKRPEWEGGVKLVDDAWKPLIYWESPQIVFVCPYSDFFHEAIPDWVRDEALAQISDHSQHSFVIVTKRSETMREYLMGVGELPKNLWISVSVESAAFVDRISDLLDVATANRAIQAEPLLGPLDLRGWVGPDKVRWVAAGPELGIYARPCHVDWMRALRDACAEVEIPFFTKHLLDGKEHRQTPFRQVRVVPSAS